MNILVLMAYCISIGFRPKHNTVLGIEAILDFIIKSFENNCNSLKLNRLV